MRLRSFCSPLVFAAIAGCSANARNAVEVEPEEPWFCEINEPGDDWDCVQDAGLARAPKPKRLPGDFVDEDTAVDDPDSVASMIVTEAVESMMRESDDALVRDADPSATASEQTQMPGEDRESEDDESVPRSSSGDERGDDAEQ